MQRRLALFVCLFLLSFSLFVSFFYLVPWPWIVFRPKANMNTHTHTHTYINHITICICNSLKCWFNHPLPYVIVLTNYMVNLAIPFIICS